VTTTVKVTRIYTGDDQRSHFEDLELPLRLTEVGALSAAIPIDSMFVRSTAEAAPPSTPDDGPLTRTWDHHVAPRRQFALHLVGVTEIEVGDGTCRRFGPGDLLLADDLTGQGHISREIEGPRLQVFARVPDDFDLDPWRS
jgi:hypothetical protein